MQERLPQMAWKERILWCLDYGKKKFDVDNAKAVAKKMKLSDHFFGTLKTRLEKDPNASRDFETCRKIAQALDISEHWLYDGYRQPWKKPSAGLSTSQRAVLASIAPRLQPFDTETRFKIHDAIVERFRELLKVHGERGAERPVWIAEANDIIAVYERAEKIARDGT